MGNQASAEQFKKGGMAVYQGLKDRGVWQTFVDGITSTSRDCGKPYYKEEIEPYMSCTVNKTMAGHAQTTMLLLALLVICLIILGYIGMKKVMKYTKNHVMTTNVQTVNTTIGQQSSELQVTNRQVRRTPGSTVVDLEAGIDLDRNTWAPQAANGKSTEQSRNQRNNGWN